MTLITDKTYLIESILKCTLLNMAVNNKSSSFKYLSKESSKRKRDKDDKIKTNQYEDHLTNEHAI